MRREHLVGAARAGHPALLDRRRRPRVVGRLGGEHHPAVRVAVVSQRSQVYATGGSSSRRPVDPVAGPSLPEPDVTVNEPSCAGPSSAGRCTADYGRRQRPPDGPDAATGGAARVRRPEPSRRDHAGRAHRGPAARRRPGGLRRARLRRRAGRGRRRRRRGQPRHLLHLLHEQGRGARRADRRDRPASCRPSSRSRGRARTPRRPSPPVIDRFVDVFAEHADVVGTWLEASAHEPHFRQRLREVRDGYIARVAEQLGPALAGTPPRPEVAAAALVAMVEGYATQGLRADDAEDRASRRPHPRRALVRRPARRSTQPPAPDPVRPSGVRDPHGPGPRSPPVSRRGPSTVASLDAARVPDHLAAAAGSLGLPRVHHFAPPRRRPEPSVAPPGAPIAAGRGVDGGRRGGSGPCASEPASDLRELVRTVDRWRGVT